MPWRAIVALLCAELVVACGAQAPLAGGKAGTGAVATPSIRVVVAGLCCAGPGYLAVQYANFGGDIARDGVLTLRLLGERPPALVRATVVPAAVTAQAATWHLPDLYPGNAGEIDVWMPTQPGEGGTTPLGRYQANLKAEGIAAVESPAYDQRIDLVRSGGTPDEEGIAVFSAVGNHYEAQFQGRRAIVLGPAPGELLRLGGRPHHIRGAFLGENLLVVREIAPEPD